MLNIELYRRPLGKCPVSRPTITSSSDGICRVMSQGLRALNYTCTNNNVFLTWSTSAWTGDLKVSTSGMAPSIPALNFGGVTLTEKNMYNNNCLFSTVTFTGTLSNLKQLNEVVLTCADPLGETDKVTIVVPSKLKLTPCMQ